MDLSDDPEADSKAKMDGEEMDVDEDLEEEGNSSNSSNDGVDDNEMGSTSSDDA